MSVEILKGTVYLGSAEPSSGGGQTINNEDITITSNGTYTAGEGYTGIGTATVNVPNPSTGTLSITENGSYNVTNYASASVEVPEGDVVTATNTTGAAISAGDKVWLEKVSGGWNAKNIRQSAKKLRWFRVGSYASYTESFINDTTGIAQGFTSSTYSVSHYFRDFDFTKPWTFHTHVKTASSLSNRFIYSGDGNSSDGARNMGFWIRADSSVLETLFNNGVGQIRGGTVSASTEYWLECGWTGTEYFFRYSDDGETFVNVGNNISSTTPLAMTGYQFFLGYLEWFDAPWGDGSIYLNDTYFESEGVEYWRGYFPNITTDDLTGFATENIAVSGTGEVKVALPEEITVTVTVDANNAKITAE